VRRLRINLDASTLTHRVTDTQATRTELLGMSEFDGSSSNLEEPSDGDRSSSEAFSDASRQIADREITDREITDREITDREITDREITDREIADREIADELFDAIRPASPRSAESNLPKRIRRYRVERLLGSGSFGRVFLAHDDQLQRDVAIKVPASEVLNQPSKAHAYLEEARTIANLEHPNIVPVYDVGSTYDFPCFIVTKYIDGTNLAEAVGKKKPTVLETIRWVSAIARALHYAHGMGVVHRDVKPENILIEPGGKPFLVDLGLALTNENVGLGPRTLGTPAYMSPNRHAARVIASTDDPTSTV
jgi:predicted Ser/Thr protein kinase